MSASPFSGPPSPVRRRNDKQAAAYASQEKLCIVGDLPEGEDLVAEAFKAVVMREFLLSAPFCDELNADVRRYEGKQAVAGVEGFYAYEQWESDRVAEGSGTVPLRLAEEVGAARIRYSTPVERIKVAPSGCVVTGRSGERFEAAAVVSALPVGPLRNIHVEGVSEERMASLRHQRNALGRPRDGGLPAQPPLHPRSFRHT